MKKSIATFLLISMWAFVLTAQGNLFYQLQQKVNPSEEQAHVLKECIQALSPLVQIRAISTPTANVLVVHKEDQIDDDDRAIKKYFISEHLRTDSPLKAYKYALQLYTSDS